jgi:hypothetical protein
MIKRQTVRIHHLILSLAAAMLWPASPARAILIETGPGVQVGGYFVRQDANTLTIRIRLPHGKEKVAEYELAKIKIIHQLDRGRLEKLSQENPQAYRVYAEELALKKADPEARDVAMRLFLISAYLDRSRLGHSSLLQMSALASTPAEARRCRAMAFVLDPKADESVLRTDPETPMPVGKAEAGSLQELIKALQSFRAGQVKLAKDAAAREGMDKTFRLAPGMLSRAAFVQKCNDAQCAICRSKGKVTCPQCKGKGTTSAFGQVQRCLKCNGQRSLACTTCDGTGVNQPAIDEVLGTILRAELWALDQLSGAAAPAKEKVNTNWSSLLQSRRVSPAAPLSLETISEFDPRKCLYRNGMWVAP